MRAEPRFEPPAGDPAVPDESNLPPERNIFLNYALLQGPASALIIGLPGGLPPAVDRHAFRWHTRCETGTDSSSQGIKII